MEQAIKVEQRGKRWAVKRQGQRRALKVLDTEQEAMLFVTKLLKASSYVIRAADSHDAQFFGIISKQEADRALAMLREMQVQ